MMDDSDSEWVEVRYAVMIYWCGRVSDGWSLCVYYGDVDCRVIRRLGCLLTNKSLTMLQVGHETRILHIKCPDQVQSSNAVESLETKDLCSQTKKINYTPQCCQSMTSTWDERATPVEARVAASPIKLGQAYLLQHQTRSTIKLISHQTRSTM